ncbi:TraV family lipoprotein [Noviherbaspirillum galbum]|uniref:TraV family lipoprotein n=1 Tax=Noviherbaspirillum galbum TaxID=2709383 RepID=A0A6B3SXV5_9BURK|nr:TraV family lipoprotein [Noviherbaspirillum galbum]NEX63392.1 TraV family lipoprotein [Noviherbaspirillum galbum]
MRLLALCAILTTLSGCTALIGGSNETVCGNGMGVPCTSIRSAYSMSNHTTQFAAQGQSDKAMADAPVSAVAVSLPQPVAQPMPVLEPAKVMRVWVNKWVDASGNLNYPSLVFSEVTPRRWAGVNQSKQPPGQIVTAYRILPNTEDATMVTSSGKPFVSKAAPGAPVPAKPAALPTGSTGAGSNGEPTPVALPKPGNMQN